VSRTRRRRQRGDAGTTHRDTAADATDGDAVTDGDRVSDGSRIFDGDTDAVPDRDTIPDRDTVADRNTVTDRLSDTDSVTDTDATQCAGPTTWVVGGRVRLPDRAGRRTPGLSFEYVAFRVDVVYEPVGRSARTVGVGYLNKRFDSFANGTERVGGTVELSSEVDGDESESRFDVQLQYRTVEYTE
jgi:hypothetical protein